MRQSSCFDEWTCLHLQLRHVNTDVAVKNYNDVQEPNHFDFDVFHFMQMPTPMPMPIPNHMSRDSSLNLSY